MLLTACPRLPNAGTSYSCHHSALAFDLKITSQITRHPFNALEPFIFPRSNFLVKQTSALSGTKDDKLAFEQFGLLQRS